LHIYIHLFQILFLRLRLLLSRRIYFRFVSRPWVGYWIYIFFVENNLSILEGVTLCASRADCQRTIHRFIVLWRLSVLKMSGRRVPSPISHYARKLVPAHTYDVSLPAARAAAVKSRITAAVWNRGCSLQPALVSRQFQPSFRLALRISTSRSRIWLFTRENFLRQESD